MTALSRVTVPDAETGGHLEVPSPSPWGSAGPSTATGGTGKAEEGTSTSPSSAAPKDSPAGQPDPRSGRTLDSSSDAFDSDAGRPGPDDAVWRSLCLTLARFGYVEWGDPPGRSLAEAFIETLAEHGYAVVDGLTVAPKWGAGPLVQLDDSRCPARGGAGGEPAGGGASAGGEVVPEVQVGMPSGTTEPAGCSAGGWVAVGSVEGAAGPVVRTAGPADGEAWFVADHERGWTRVERA